MAEHDAPPESGAARSPPAKKRGGDARSPQQDAQPLSSRDRVRERDEDKDRERHRRHGEDRERYRDRESVRERGEGSRDRERHRREHREESRDRERHHREHREGSRDRERHHREHREGSRDRERHHREHREGSRDRERHHRDHREGSRDRERHHRDHRERSERREHRDRSDDRDYRRSCDRDAERRDRDRDGHRRHRSRSPLRSESQSKRMSGFDQRPSEAIPILAPDATPSQLPELPAANPGMFPNMLPNLVNVPALGQPLAMTQQATRHARRVYVGGLPPIANEQTVAVFFNQVMAAIGGNTFALGHAVVNVYINHDKKFAFVEMRSVEEASNAMALDGIMFEGAPVKVRRPTDYNPSQAAALGPSQPNPNLNLAAVGLTPGAGGGLEGPDRIFVGGLPYYFTEAQVRELLETFGPLRGFDIVKDKETGNSKGYAFCLYKDGTVTDIACAALNGIQLGDRTLTVRRANQGAEPRPEQENILLQAQQEAQMKRLVYEVGRTLTTKVVCLTQVVSADDLRDDEEYNDILEDMTLEGHKYVPHSTIAESFIIRPHAKFAIRPKLTEDTNLFHLDLTNHMFSSLPFCHVHVCSY
uniref:Splicing factor U2af large subunit A n=1 Tax=Triticum aestivum TaxID=4565 RepID=U2A2A_WHEAT|nr:RecName: Full=Splicing factor U2af large subunit A; AltName: Full=U2 auxiliary factor 65 kDa subunit A; AltName: Full=U2 small nuclear ribonucleoprotein auxiliary factor large subunit A; Short=U2 snRNP auxiliary factor large subunit A [Triticum aestivum]AAY84881.1 U2AF large subunit [Triticum aestivum]